VNDPGAGCLCAFFSIFFLAGCGFLLLMVWTVALPEVRANTRYVPKRCVVLDKKMGLSEGDEGWTYRPEILVRYAVAGRVYETWAYDASRAYTSGLGSNQAILDRFVVGREYPCWHDPDAPARVVLVRGYRGSLYLFMVIPLVFIVVGAAGMSFALYVRGKSPERLAASWSSRRRARAEAKGGTGTGTGTGAGLANVPEIDLADRPGATLAFRLPYATAPGCRVLGLLAMTLFWNGIVSVFVVEAVRGHLRGDPSWFLTIFLIPFVLFGLLFIGLFVKELLVVFRVGPTVVEISDHPLRPGGTYEVFVSQSGRLAMNSLSVALECVESATYRQGTDRRTETCVVREVVVVRAEGFAIEHGLPFEARRLLVVPPGAMHSFRATNNQVLWRLVVVGDIAGWPNFRREFPVVVRPAPGSGGPT
jgi:hypothetical protein